MGLRSDQWQQHIVKDITVFCVKNCLIFVMFTTNTAPALTHPTVVIQKKMLIQL